MPMKYSQEVRLRASKMREAGARYVDISRATGVSEDTLGVWFRHSPQRVPSTALSLDTEAITRCYKAGLSVQSIGRHFGCNQHSLKRLLQSMGIPVRGNSEARKASNSLRTRIWDMRCEGKSVTSISRHLGVWEDFVRETVAEMEAAEMPMEAYHREHRPFRQRVYGVTSWEVAEGR